MGALGLVAGISTSVLVRSAVVASTALSGHHIPGASFHAGPDLVEAVVAAEVAALCLAAAAAGAMVFESGALGLVAALFAPVLALNSV